MQFLVQSHGFQLTLSKPAGSNYQLCEVDVLDLVVKKALESLGVEFALDRGFFVDRRWNQDLIEEIVQER